MTEFKIGDRVKLSARGLDMFPEWANVGFGEVVGHEGGYTNVKFDKHPLTRNDLAYHLPDELELVEEEPEEAATSVSREQKLESAVMIAAYIFEEYHRQHLEKEMSPATVLKAMANRALADIMHDALDAD